MTTPNPLARARRLGAALLELRNGYTHAELSKRSGVSASVISRLENPFSDIGRTPNLRLVRKLLDALEVERGSDRWNELEGYAEDVAGGWWDEPQYAEMGQGQRDAAILEYGAKEIRQYSGLLLPGLVQTAAYARERVLTASNADAIVAGRLARQHVIESAKAYELVFEVQAVRRYPVPPAVMREQLHHLLNLGRRKNVSIRVARVEGQIGDGATPRGPFAHITYTDPGDPRIVAVDNVTGDMLVTDAAEVAGYAQLHERLCTTALSDADSAAIILEVAERLAAEI
jgi:transcriptional regulator with XRE-family HTH domain